MKRRRRNSRGGGRRRSGQGKGKESERGHNSNKTSKKKDPYPPPPPPVLGTVATRTRRQQRDIATKWNQPISILIHIMGYADPETIRTLCCVSKQFSDLISNDSRMEQNRAVPLLQIRPSKEQEEEGRLGRLLRLLYHHRDKLQHYRMIKIIDVHKFAIFILHEFGGLKKITDTLQLYGVVSLDMSSPTPTKYFTKNNTDNIWDEFLCRIISSILPNLRDVNLSNNGFPSASLLEFSRECPKLQKITWHNIDCKQSRIKINGQDMEPATNLKEIYMDNATFSGSMSGWRSFYADLEDDDPISFFFHYCSKKLERVSIRNAKMYDLYGGHDGTTVIPQTALIKFVRNASASLRWFRSDLSDENMTMLRLERPGIELLN